MEPNVEESRIDTLLKKAGQLFQSGKLTEAKQNYLEALDHLPDDYNLNQIIGLIENELENYHSAEIYLKKAISEDPKHCSAYIHIGQLYIQQNQAVNALQVLKQAINNQISKPELFCLIGDAYKQLKRHQKAVNWYLKAINQNPEYLLAYNKLGNCYNKLNLHKKAFQCYHKAIEIRPNDAKTLHNLGNIYLKIGSPDDAIRCYQKALSQSPEIAGIHYSLGNALERKKDFELANHSFRNALSITPESHVYAFSIGTNLKIQGKIEECQQWFERSTKLKPDFQPAKIHHYLTLPTIYSDAKEIDVYREEYSKGIDLLINDWNKTKQSNPALHLSGLKTWSNFYLPYQGKIDLPLQKKIGTYIFSVMKENHPDKSNSRSITSPVKRDKIRVGYVSNNMFSHTVGKLFIGWVENADQSVFEIFCYHTGNRSDQMTKRYKSASFKFRQMVDGIEMVADQIVSDDLDILVYLDIGMNALSQMLSGMRLAPIQCATWGHPVTTGSPSIDYFLSSDLMEPSDGQDHYSETLIRLPNLSIFYNKPDFPVSPEERKHFGLIKDDFVYFTSQSLFKYLPDDDFIYVKIALSVPKSKFVFIEHESKHVTTLFKKRIANAFLKERLDYETFCVFQPRLAYPDFIGMNTMSDVLLDPPAWSGGMTSLEGISCGLPAVTLPGKLMRSRHTYAILKFAGIDETIAKNRDDYIRIAIQLAADSDFYNRCRDTMSRQLNRIYEDGQSIKGLEDFYKSLMYHEYGDRPACAKGKPQPE